MMEREAASMVWSMRATKSTEAQARKIWHCLGGCQLDRGAEKRTVMTLDLVT